MDKLNLEPQRLAQHIYKSAAVLDTLSWEKVNRKFICKSITELMHEVLIKPLLIKTVNDINFFELTTDIPTVKYYFKAVSKSLDHWQVFPESVSKIAEGKEMKLNGLDFFMEMQHIIGIKPHTFAHFLEEIHRTLYADCFIEKKFKLYSDELADADYQQIERQMTGHPWLIMNKGRIGFNYDDYIHYAPEAQSSTKLLWIAVHHAYAAFNSIARLSYAHLIETELGTELMNEFNEIIYLKGLDVNDYYLMPVHEWQWNNKLIFLFASEIAEKRIIPMAFGNDEYNPQQSIRTLYNKTMPQKYYVKTALTILNTTLYRGLSPAKLKVAPMIATWVEKKLEKDPFLEACGFTLLNEVATISYTHPYFNNIKEAPYQYTEMLGVIWRESITSKLVPKEKPVTMAALLYIDAAGKPLIQSFIQKSGLSVEKWIAAYLSAYFNPLLHCFYKHQMFFLPHGENTIVVLKDYVPVRIVLKDFVEEIQLAPDAYRATADHIRNILYEIPEEDVTLFVFVDIFVGVFRYLSALLSTHLGYKEELFWQQVAAVINDYQQQFPELETFYKRYNLFVPEFRRFCLNRFRLVTFGYGESSSIPSAPPYAGLIKNPISAFS